MALTAKKPTRREDKAAEKLLADVTGTAEKKKRLNAEVEESLYARIKVKAAQEGRTISAITRDMWIAYLSK